MHATEFLSAPAVPELGGVLVLFGPERFFRGEVLKRIPGASGDEAGLSLSRYQGSQAEYTAVTSDLRTVSMFGDQRVVLVEDADEFVSANRAALEKLAVAPAKRALLILDVKSWPKNARLFKLVDQHGLAVDCGELTGTPLLKWLQKLARDEYDKQLDRDSAALMVQLAGEGLTLLQQEIGKLASLAGDAPAITREDVENVVGGWRMETTWEMLDAVRDNQPGRALRALDKLLTAGEAPQKILGGVTFTFRKFADATERARLGMPLREALAAAGVFSSALDAGEAFLRRLRYEKASRILQQLIEADTDMKGGSRVEPRLLLERLFVRLAGETTVGAGT